MHAIKNRPVFQKWWYRYVRSDGTGASEVWTYKWCVTEVFCQSFSSSYSLFSLGIILGGQNQQDCLVELRFIPYSIKVYIYVCVCVCVCVCCAVECVTGSTVAYWGSGRAAVACEHSNIIIMILPQNCCAVCRWSSSVSLVTKVRAGWSRAQILIGARDFSFLQHAHTGAGTHPIPC